ncbi:HYR domain-containing protein, partial [Bacteroidota bacterium]
IDLSKLPDLEILNCIANRLVYINLSSNTNLLELYCMSNELAHLDLSANTKLTGLYCFNNELPSLNLSTNTDLTKLHCNDNLIQEIDLSFNVLLEDFYCQNNGLTNLDLSNNPTLRKLWFGNNYIDNIDLTANPLLEEFWCESNLLTELNLNENTLLKDLNCSRNYLSYIDISRNEALVNLYCQHNDLSNLELSFNTSLERLDCSSNDLVCLDISQNTILKLLRINNMLGLTRVCVWIEPFNPYGLEIEKNGSPQVVFSANCGIEMICPDDVYLLTDPGGNSIIVDNIALDFFSYSCNLDPDIYYELSGATIATGSDDASGILFNLGKTTVKYYLGLSDNPPECSFNVYVTDPSVLSIVCPVDIELPTLFEGAETYMLFNNIYPEIISVNFTTVDYLLSGATIGGGLNFMNGSGIVFNLGITYVKFIVRDHLNNKVSCTFIVNIIGNPDLEIICPENIIRSNDLGECFATVYDLKPEMLGGSPTGLSLEYLLGGATQGEGDGDVSGMAFNVGKTSILYTLTDSLNNTTHCGFDITILDAESPFIYMPDLPVDLNEFGQYLIVDYTVLAFVNDNCVNEEDISVSQLPLIGTIISSKTAVTLTVDDGRGNEGEYTFYVIPGDNIPPFISCPPTQSEVADENCQIILRDYRSLAEVKDNYDDNPDVSQDPQAGTIVSKNTIINISAADSSGNISSCTFSVMINDTISPEIFGPGDLIECENYVDYSIPVATDNCSDAIVVQTDNTGLTSGSIFPDGITTLEYTATDLAGNITFYSFTITVLPDPVVTLGSFLIDNVCYRTIPISLPEGLPAGGSYSGAGIDGDMFNPIIAGVGTHTISYWVVDSFGCIGVDSTSITVDECSNISGDVVFIYPNPAKEYLNIVYTEGENIENITIIDNQGRRVWEKEINESYYVLDVSDFKLGLYFLQVKLPENSNSSGSNYVYKKFIRN